MVNRMYVLAVGFLLLMLIGTLVACDSDMPLSASDLDSVSPGATESRGEIQPPTLPPVATRSLDAPPAAPAGEEDGTGKWALWTQGSHLRGANIYQRRVYAELDGPEFYGPGPVGPPYTQQDFDRLAAMGANYVNISHPGLFSEEPPYILDQGIQDNLDNLLSMIARADMYAVITFRTGPGRSEFWAFWGEDIANDPSEGWFDSSYFNNRVWGDQAAQDAWSAMWAYTAQRYRDNPIVVGYDLMCEPNSNEVGSYPLGEALDSWEPDEFYAQYGGTLYDWNQLTPRITSAIRAVDPETPILIGGNGYSGVEWLPYIVPTGDPRTVYAAHQYAPHLYSHQWPDALDCSYPGACDLDWDGEYDDRLDRAWLEDLLSTLDEFAITHNVPLAVNEFGAARWVPGAAEYIDDEMELFEQRGLNHALWLWETSWPPIQDEIDANNFRHGPDPDNHTDVASSDLMDVIQKHWGGNTLRPSSALTATSHLPVVVTAPGSGAGPLPLEEVKTWAYQIQGVSEPGAVDALAASHYDLLVLEPTRTDWSSDDKGFDTPAMVARLKGTKAGDGQHDKLVLAYIDIGEAEDWRWYWTWSTDWDCQPPVPADWPDYILSCDPDGWAGNYPLAYWDERWKDLVIYGQNQDTEPGRDYTSIIDEVIRSGFDGIYLDWVEAFEDDVVIGAAQAEGLDPAVEMIAFIREMKDYAAARDPDFLIIQQNAAALIDGHPELMDVIDAIAQEAIWYDGDSDVDWGDSAGHDWENDAGLVTYYLDYLAEYLAAGLPVFDCEYAVDQAATAYANSYAEGFVPYATRRSLEKLTTTPPPGH